MFSLGLSGTGRPDKARSLSLTADVPPWVMVNLIGCDSYRKTHLNRMFWRFPYDLMQYVQLSCRSGRSAFFVVEKKFFCRCLRCSNSKRKTTLQGFSAPCKENYKITIRWIKNEKFSKFLINFEACPLTSGLAVWSPAPPRPHVKVSWEGHWAPSCSWCVCVPLWIKVCTKWLHLNVMKM